MKKNILLRTNLLVCIVIVAGFLLTALLSYRANYGAAIENIEQVSALTSEGLYYQLSATFTKPVNVSQTMANDSLLRELLLQEPEDADDRGYIERVKDYLGGYRAKYGYDAVFLVSEATGRYYNFNGLDRQIVPDNPENVWYYELRELEADYALAVDNDEVAGADNEITVFVNCKILDQDGRMMGAVGVGLRIRDLQQMLESYQEQFEVDVLLIDGDGAIQLSTEHTGYEKVDLFALKHYGEELRQEILTWREEGTAHSFWSSARAGADGRFIVTRYVPELDWHLVVERDTTQLIRRLEQQLAMTVAVICVILLVILFVISYVIRGFNREIIALTQAVEQKRRTVFERATGELFENIYEVDITCNRPANRATEEYFESLDVPKGTPYDQTLGMVAQRQIKEEFRQGYLDTFSTKSVLQAYREGRETLRYEFLITRDGVQYYWMRVTGQLVYWESDGSIHMLIYRQNIDAEKQQEQRMYQLAQTDEMTGLLTKSAARRAMEALLAASEGCGCALFLFDIDNFKQANDLYGHAFGDSVILAFVRTIRGQFRTEDVLGRMGGDEFAALIPVPDEDWARRKAEELVAALNQEHRAEGRCWHMTASIGVAMFPRDGTDQETLYRCADQALYLAKTRGRNGCAFFGD